MPNSATVCIFMTDGSSSRDRRGDAGFRGIEGGGQTLLLAVIAGTIPEFRPADAGRLVRTDQVAVGVFAGHFVDEQVLRDDDVTLETHHLGDVGDLARAVAQ